MAKRRPPTPPCPDSEKYVLVRGRYRSFWRKKRFLNSTPTVNVAFEEATDTLRKVMPVTLRIKDALSPYIGDLETDWLHTRINGRFVHWLTKGDPLSFEPLEGLEMQKSYPLRNVLLMYHGNHTKAMAVIQTGSL